MRLILTLGLLLSAKGVSLFPPHPRLILTPARRAALGEAIASDATASQLHALTLRQALAVQEQRPPSPSGPHATPSARVRLQNLYSLVLSTLGGGGNASALEARARAEVVGPCSSPAWDLNGTVQLNTGEMLHVCGFALDWLFDILSPGERGVLVGALTTHLQLVNDALGASPPPWAVSFVSTRSNWNSVILGGAIMGALAVASEPGVPAWVLEELLPRATGNLLAWSAQGWGPDGAWPEGPNYGAYAVRYLAPTVAALISATGSDAGLTALPGVLQSPRYLLSSMAPNLEYFYYYDTRSDPETVAAYLAFAVLAQDGQAQRGVLDLVLALAPNIPPNSTGNNVMNAPVALLYYPPSPPPAAAAAADPGPLVSHFRGAELVTARASASPGAAFAAFKGRNTSYGLWAHTHLDGGTFVWQYRGQWWVQDLGSDSYSAPGYFWKTRFSLYRTGSLGHNTLTFGGANQHCEILSTYACNCSEVPLQVLNASAPAGAGAGGSTFAVGALAIADLTQAYAPLGLGLQRSQRGFIASRSVEQVILVDEVALLSPPPGRVGDLPPLWWSMHTVADVALGSDGLSAALTLANVTGTVVTVRVLPSASECPGASFAVFNIGLLPPLLPSPQVKRLTLIAPAADRCTRLSVAIGLLNSSFDLSIRPLAEWERQGPFL